MKHKNQRQRAKEPKFSNSFPTIISKKEYASTQWMGVHLRAVKRQRTNVNLRVVARPHG